MAEVIYDDYRRVDGVKPTQPMNLAAAVRHRKYSCHGADLDRENVDDELSMCPVRGSPKTSRQC